MLKLHQEKYY